jgi:hypothetical protein
MIGIVKAAMKHASDYSVYLVESGLGLARIGVAPEPGKRLRELQVGSPVRLKLALAAPYRGREAARAVADELARHFAARRSHGHWFRVTTAEVRRALASPAIRRAPTTERARAAARLTRASGRGALAPTEKQRAYQRRRRRARAAKQKRAAKLLARGRKQLEVAAALELSARTLRNWSKTPGFQRTLARERARFERAQVPSVPRRRQPERRARRSPGQRQPAEARATAAPEREAAGTAETEHEPENDFRGDRLAADVRRRQRPPHELEPYSKEWRAWYAQLRDRSYIDRLNDYDARHGRIPPDERRARQRAQQSPRRPRRQH